MEHGSTGEADIGPPTSNKPLCGIQIELAKEIENLKSSEDADRVPLPVNKPLIQKVPQTLRSCYGKEDCERYFEPTSVAIGPLHHKRENDRDPRMERGERCKLKLAAMFIKDSKSRKEDFYENVMKDINSLKSCYNFEGVEKWTEEQLAWMFLVDGCALLHFIVRDVNYDWERFSVNNGLVSIDKMDFFLLENQLPYKLLEILIESFAKAFREPLAQNNPKKLLEKCIAEFINRSFLRLTAQQEHQIRIDYSQPHPEPHHLLDLLQRGQKFINRSILKRTAQQEHQIRIDNSQPHPEPHPPHPPHHLLDLLQRGLKFIKRSSLKRTAQQEHQNQPDHPHHLLALLRRRLIGEKGEKREEINKDGFWETLISGKSKYSPFNARELKEKGIHFKAKEKGSAITNNDFKARCCMATLMLAPIFLHNTTVPLLLNLIAYELCPGFEENWEITSYLSLLDSLIDNGEDAKELKDAGVLDNGLGSDEAVAELLNKISGILVPNFKVDSGLRRKIHDYYWRKKSHLSRLCGSIQAKLTQTYFRRPWSFLVFLGAIAGLIMTGMQTYYSFHENMLDG